jgi:hypothetical protein
MHASFDDASRAGSGRGPAMYFGYCGRTNRYRMMDLPEYTSNMQQSISRWMSDAAATYQNVLRGYTNPTTQRPGRSGHQGHECGCGSECDDGHCECRVCDADVLVHARCGELRRIPVTFANDTRRERPVKLTIDPFKTSAGRDLKWTVTLSETEFALGPCGEQTVTAAVQVRCDTSSEGKPNDPEGERGSRSGSVDHCEVGYARLHAEACLVRPIVLAVAVLPDDCDAYRRPCGCGCCR